MGMLKNLGKLDGLVKLASELSSDEKKVNKPTENKETKITEEKEDSIMSNIEELKGLAELKEQGILTEEEFQKEKEKILSRGSKTEEASPKSTPEPESESTPESGTSGKKSSGWFRTGKSAEDQSPEVQAAMKKDPELIKQRKKLEEATKKLGESLDKSLKDPLKF